MHRLVADGLALGLTSKVAEAIAERVRWQTYEPWMATSLRLIVEACDLAIDGGLPLQRRKARSAMLRTISHWLGPFAEFDIVEAAPSDDWEQIKHPKEFQIGDGALYWRRPKATSQVFRQPAAEKAGQVGKGAVHVLLSKARNE